MGDFWVFGYGSLMWRPGFAHEEKRKARLFGFRRSLCVLSHVHRGTPDMPGLVLGLDRGGSCLGLAFRVADENRDEVLTYLRARELVTNVYHERFAGVRLQSGEVVRAVCFTVDRAHEQYGGSIDIDHAVSVVRDAVGQSGANVEYVLNTVDHLRALGIRDHWLEAVADRLGARNGDRINAVAT